MKKCKTCGGKMEMYYKEWCPLCEKPQVKMKPVLNLLQCIHHIETLTGDLDVGKCYEPNFKRGFRDRIWSHMCDVYEFRNDSYFQFTPGYEYDYCYDHRLKNEKGESGVLNEDLKLLVDTFNIDHEHGVLFEVSW